MRNIFIILLLLPIFSGAQIIVNPQWTNKSKALITFFKRDAAGDTTCSYPGCIVNHSPRVTLGKLEYGTIHILQLQETIEKAPYFGVKHDNDCAVCKRRRFYTMMHIVNTPLNIKMLL